MNKFLLIFLMIFVSNNSTFTSDSSDREFDNFYEALSDGNIAFALLLFDSNPEFKNVRNDQDQTLLHSAILHRFPEEAISFLIENGWDINAQDLDGKTPLMYALSERDNEEMIQALLNANGLDITLEDNVKKTAVNYAARYYPRIAYRLEEHLKYLQDWQESENAQEYFATLPNTFSYEMPLQGSLNYENNWTQSSLDGFQSEKIDWNLDKQSDSQVQRLGRAEDKKRILENMGQFFENGAGI